MHQEIEAALTDCKNSLQLRPGDAYALDGRGFVHLVLDEPAEALADFDNALKIEPRLAEALVRLRLSQVKDWGPCRRRCRDRGGEGN